MNVTRRTTQSPLGFHFLLLSSASGKSVFAGDDDRRKLNDVVREVVDELKVRVHAHCWLNNEIELVAETGAVAPERLLRKIAAAYTSAVNGRMSRNGILFSDQHICYEPESESELVDIVRSMHVRPVMLDLTEDCVNYPWSSVRAYRGLEDIPWLTKGTLGPLMEREASAGSQPGLVEGTVPQSAPRMIADAVEAKLSREMVDRSRVWMARALIAWVVTRDGIATLEAAASRFGVDATALGHAMRKYLALAPDLFVSPLPDVMRWSGFEIASPKARKDIASILSSISQWAH
jgi:hypothetical protein